MTFVYLIMWLPIGIFLVFEACYLKIKGMPKTKVLRALFILVPGLVGITYIAATLVNVIFAGGMGSTPGIWEEWGG